MSEFDFGVIDPNKKVFFISDTHFYHTNVIEYCNRPFHNVHEMNQYIIDQWNSKVSNDDIVYFLGDFALGQCDKEEIYKELSIKLHGTICFVKGNHDRSTECLSKYFNVLPDRFIVTYGDMKFILSHRPLPYSEIPKGYINIHGHIHDIILSEQVRDYKDPTKIIYYGKKCHKNVSVDVTGFAPLFFGDIVKEIENGDLKWKESY